MEVDAGWIAGIITYSRFHPARVVVRFGLPWVRKVPERCASGFFLGLRKGFIYRPQRANAAHGLTAFISK